MAADGPAFSIADAPAHEGREIGLSQWVAVEQERIDLFARATDDGYWIHTDPVRAKDGPFGATIAHGFLSLSLLTPLVWQAGMRWGDEVTGLNYGLDKVRFLAPVKAGQRVRARVVLAKAERRPDGAMLLHMDVTVEIEGGQRPALVARWLNLFVPRP